MGDPIREYLEDLLSFADEADEMCRRAAELELMYAKGYLHSVGPRLRDYARAVAERPDSASYVIPPAAPDYSTGDLPF